MCNCNNDNQNEYRSVEKGTSPPRSPATIISNDLPVEVTPPVDWDRWHELLDILAERTFTLNEMEEYNEMREVAEKLDDAEAERCEPIVDALVARHERVIASLESLARDDRAVLIDAVLWDKPITDMQRRHMAEIEDIKNLIRQLEEGAGKRD